MAKYFQKQKRKGAAVDYVLVAVLFAMVAGIAVFQLSPDLLRKFFEKTIDDSTTTTGGTLQMKTLGE